MTLLDILKSIGKMAINEKVVNDSIVGLSLGDVNATDIKEYPLIFTQPYGSHTTNGDATIFSINIYYIDRLLDDSSNNLDILSFSIEQLKNIVNGIRDIEGVISVDDEYVINNFIETERLNDRCCGAYTTIRIIVANDFVCHID